MISNILSSYMVNIDTHLCTKNVFTKLLLAGKVKHGFRMSKVQLYLSSKFQPFYLFILNTPSYTYFSLSIISTTFYSPLLHEKV